MFLSLLYFMLCYSDVKGTIVTLDEDGHLSCSYLGTDPSIFSRAPIETRDIDYQRANTEMAALQKAIAAQQNNIGKSLSGLAANFINYVEYCSISYTLFIHYIYYIIPCQLYMYISHNSIVYFFAVWNVVYFLILYLRCSSLFFYCSLFFVVH